MGWRYWGKHCGERLLDYGLKFGPDGKRLLFPPGEVDKAVASTPHSFTLYNRRLATPTWGMTGCILCPVPAGSRC
ncbi:MAG: hypothetical protein U0401_18270 [Anaerolineae bacterium]